jgi:transcriptional regulator with XRE-family HTH domain
MARTKSREIRDPHPIRSYRIRHGLAMADLAARAEISKAALSLIETYATKLPSFPVIGRLVVACEGEVTACDIFRSHFDAGGAP